MQRPNEDEIRRRYLNEIKPDPEIYCTLTFGIHKIGNPTCVHEWERVKDMDDYAVWKCKKCPAKAGCDVGE